MNIKKVPAFTIIEVLIALILTAVVFTISFLSYKIVQDQFKDYSNSADRLVRYLELQKIINLDVDNSLYIEVTDEGFDSVFSDKSIHYFISDSLVVRRNENAVIDSFKFQIVNKQFLFKKNIVTEPGKCFDNLTLTLNINDQQSFIIAKKEYDAQTLMDISLF
ncbi:hypothetical protein [Albibacterium sp.]|uniref:PulJ/GspJ family protein n=1 Tax=Albibacterium sp. TaxID=2952885 RepID=UPI002D0B5C4F|nr:hypothetical protein [Albibacterium sp.]HUH17851.1 hypothetical protein [Albibacterium sp.]